MAVGVDPRFLEQGGLVGVDDPRLEFGEPSLGGGDVRTLPVGVPAQPVRHLGRLPRVGEDLLRRRPRVLDDLPGLGTGFGDRPLAQRRGLRLDLPYETGDALGVQPLRPRDPGPQLLRLGDGIRPTPPEQPPLARRRNRGHGTTDRGAGGGTDGKGAGGGTGDWGTGCGTGDKGAGCGAALRYPQLPALRSGRP